MGTCGILLLCSSVSVLVLSILILHIFHGNKLEEEKPVVDLAICILSARNNTDLRNAIRQSWLKDVEKLAKHNERIVLAKFVIGSKACDVHPENRVSPYNCNRWNLTLPVDLSKEVVMFSAVSGFGHVDRDRNFVSSFMIKTMHSITLKRIGIIELFPFDKIPKGPQVVLYDSVSEEEIGRSRFTHNFKGILIDGYFYKPMEELQLPKVLFPDFKKFLS